MRCVESSFAKQGDEGFETHRSRLLTRCISRMQRLEALSLATPAFASFPDCLSTLHGLVSLELRFWPRDMPVIRLPTSVTNLSRLSSLSLGYNSGGFGWGETPGARTFCAAALGSLSGFPRLRDLHFNMCRVVLSNELARAEAHPALSHLEFSCAYPCVGEHMQAVLALHRHLLQRGRRGVSVDPGRQPFGFERRELGEERYAQRVRDYQKLADFKVAVSLME